MKHVKLISVTFCLLFAFSHFASAQYTNGNARMGTLWTNYASFGHKSYQGSSSYSLLQSSTGYTILNAKNGQNIYFRDGNKGFRSNTNMFIKGSNGRVGIGTVSPSHQLHVHGTARIQGSSRYDGIMSYYTSNVRRGSVYGSSSSFGLLDKDNQWGIRMVNDAYTDFQVNNRRAMRIYKDDYVDFMDNGTRYMRLTNNNKSSGTIEFGKPNQWGANPQILAWDETMQFGNKNGTANNIFDFKGNISVSKIGNRGGKLYCKELYINGSKFVPNSSAAGQFTRSGNDITATNVKQMIIKSPSNINSTRLKFQSNHRSKSWEIEAEHGNSDDKKNELRFWFNNGTPLGFAKITGDGIFWAKDVCVSQNIGDCRDIVFEPDYKLMPLKEVEAFVKKEKHLPEIPSAKEFVEGGQTVGKFTQQLLGKIEELTLHAIAQEKRMDKMENLIEAQAKVISDLSNNK